MFCGGLASENEDGNGYLGGYLANLFNSRIGTCWCRINNLERATRVCWCRAMNNFTSIYCFMQFYSICSVLRNKLSKNASFSLSCN